MPKKNLYSDFTWWQGIVEDRNDPDKLGRYRVRIFGYHTRDKTQLPTEDLPWAIPMQPVTSAAISGVGHSATGLVEGSAVMGFFADGTDSQMPIIMGSWGSMSFLPEDENGNPIDIDRSKAGFYDPNYVYPRQKEADEETGEKVDVGKNILKEADSSRLARGPEAAESHYSLIQKRDTRIAGDEKIGKAFAPEMTSWPVKETSITHPGQDATPTPVYEQTFWEEPHPQGAETSASQYPYNHVRETESGHVFEVDDTPGAGRIHQYHNSGTYEEIQPDGTRSVKIIGEDYEIVIKDKNILIKGDLNTTVEGDYNLNILGNKYVDVQGHSFESVRGSKYSKIQGNYVKEILTNESILTVGNKWETIQANSGTGVYTKRVAGEYVRQVGGKAYDTYGKELKVNVFGDYTITTYPLVGPQFTRGIVEPKLKFGIFSVQTSGDISLKSGTKPHPITGTFPAVNITSPYINTQATLGHVEVVGIDPTVAGELTALMAAPGTPVGKFARYAIASPLGFGLDQRTVGLGGGITRMALSPGAGIVDVSSTAITTAATLAMTTTAGAAISMSAGAAVAINAGAAINVTAVGALTMGGTVTTIAGSTSIIATAPIISLN